MTRKAVSVPRLVRVVLRNFSIYRSCREIVVDLDQDVFCLAGANGLGKSTFVAALSFGITGGVAPLRGKIDQLSNYLRDSRKYAREYFEGRVTELDRDSARVEVTFMLGRSKYTITRSFFGQETLVSLEIRSPNSPTTIRLNEDSEEDLQAIYEERVLQDSGLDTFAQFVFLHHFVFTFDERRHLLFWDARASELVLYLALGLDPNLARKADELRKQASGAGSLARNAQYQATSARQQLASLVRSLEGKQDFSPQVVDEYASLLARREQLVRVRNAGQSQKTDARLELATASAEHMRLRRRYDDAFRGRLAESTNHALHPLIEESLSAHSCQVCGTRDPEGLERVARLVAERKCPLCESNLQQAKDTTGDWVAVLAEMDRALVEVGERAAAHEKTLRRLEDEIDAATAELATVEKRVEDLENLHEISLEKINTDVDEEARLQVQLLESAIEVALEAKEKHLEKRTAALAEFEPVRGALVRAWREAELEFVPRFRELAEGFIGLPLYIQLDEGAGMMGSAHLALSVNDSRRRNAAQLSESQRFFLDIALRMTLAQYMTGNNGSASLLVDTPEGALDIAYEARAGDLLAGFAARGDQLLMTANINSSQLLMRMAERCGIEGMQFVRMTEWTTLSQVQQQEEELFRRAFSQIESALVTGTGSSS